MKINKFIFVCCLFLITNIFATDFTVSSYNCGALSDHYDYIRSAVMQKVMQVRYAAEPGEMAKFEKVQQVALKILFEKNAKEQSQAQKEWDQNGYQKFVDRITSFPSDKESVNFVWMNTANAMVSTYHVRPINLVDPDVTQILWEHMQDVTRNPKADNFQDLVHEGWRVMAERIFRNYLMYDIICVQEADFLDSTIIPEGYQAVLSDNSHSVNGVIFNERRFKLLDNVGDIANRGYVVKLLDKQSKKTVLVASGHISGCNPFQTVEDKKSKELDSAKGDNELKTILQLVEAIPADIKMIGMDSNVTPLHPRLGILKDFGYQLDAENFIEPTCTNPYQILNTRLDWIAVKSDLSTTVTNIPVMGVGLNSLQTNMSDHKPIAAKVQY